MFRNYLSAALRNLARNKLHAAITILSMTLGFTGAILIALYTRDEFIYDRFIPGGQQVYQIVNTSRVGGRSPTIMTATVFPAAEIMQEKFPEIESIARISFSQINVRKGDADIQERGFTGDEDVFKVLGFPLIEGDPITALKAPDSIVLTRSMARKYFGRDHVLGETLLINGDSQFHVTGVMEDIPPNSNFNIELLVSAGAPFTSQTQIQKRLPEDRLSASAFLTYFRLKPGASLTNADPRLPAVGKQIIAMAGRQAAEYGDSNVVDTAVIPIQDIHLHSPGQSFMKPNGDLQTVYTIAGIGVLLLLIASINFVNLMTARAARRALEVGVRKAAGAERGQIVVQFLGETVLYVALAMIIAIAAALLLLPAFNAFLIRAIQFSFTDVAVLTAIVATVLINGVLAGAYPAFLLSSFRPATVLKGSKGGTSGSGRLRQILVGVQFAVLIGLMLATAVIARQTQFALKGSLRFSSDQAVVVFAPCRPAFKDEIAKLPGVSAVACSSSPPFRGGSATFTTMNRVDGEKFAGGQSRVDVGFFEMYGIKMVAGSSFRLTGPNAVFTPVVGATMVPVIINEAAARGLGYASPAAAVGQTLTWQRSGLGPQGPTFLPMAPSPIVGVVQDYVADNVRQPVQPEVYAYDPGGFGTTNIKLRGAQIPETLTAIDKLGMSLGLGGPNSGRAPQRVFVDQIVERTYTDIAKQMQVFSIFSGITAFIAVLGLLALSAYVAEQRTREIGVRKAMGAGDGSIVRLMLWQFSKPVIWASVIAVPLAAYFLNRWLHGFTYRVTLAPWIFMAVVAAAFVVAWVTVITHAYLAARTKPATALRYE